MKYYNRNSPLTAFVSKVNPICPSEVPPRRLHVVRLAHLAEISIQSVTQIAFTLQNNYFVPLLHVILLNDDVNSSAEAVYHAFGVIIIERELERQF